MARILFVVLVVAFCVFAEAEKSTELTEADFTFCRDNANGKTFEAVLDDAGYLTCKFDDGSSLRQDSEGCTAPGSCGPTTPAPVN